MKLFKKIIFSVVCFFSICAYADEFPLMDKLRDLIYEQQSTALDILPVYNAVVEEINLVFGADETEKSLALKARAEYFIGRAFLAEKNKSEAIKHFENGINLADDSLKLKKTPFALVIKAECISQQCFAKPVSYSMSNSSKIFELSDQALELESDNAAAIHLKASKNIYSPGFPDQKKSRALLLENLSKINTQNKDDLFNFYMALAVSFLRTKNKPEAVEYLLKAKELYPGNKFCTYLLEKV